MAADKRFFSIDHHVRAPRALTTEAFEIDYDADATGLHRPRVKGDRNIWGPLAVAVPGAVAGLWDAQERYGRLSARDVLRPGIELAEAGIVVDERLRMHIESRTTEISQLPDTAAWLLPGGNVPSVGSRLDGSALARTLKTIAEQGPRCLYEGPLAERISKYVLALGGVLSEADLSTYQPRHSYESPDHFLGYQYVTGTDPLGYSLVRLLSSIGIDRYEPESVDFLHLMAEALGHAYVDHMTYAGDPAFCRVPLHGLMSPGFAAARASHISLEKAAPRPIVAGNPWPFEEDPPDRGDPPSASTGGIEGTSQVTAIDSDGNVAALITTLSHPFGSLVMVPEIGIVLNDGIHVFDPRPGRNNSIAGGKTPIFYAPVYVAVRDDGAVFAASGSGGYRITTAVTTTMLMHLMCNRPLDEATHHPRVHCQGAETYVDSRVPETCVAGLRSRGHEVVREEHGPRHFAFGRVSAVSSDRGCLSLAASGDPSGVTAALTW
jgi:gamma-glutamyltranspeptidase/glutathione hydrolase